MIPLSGWSYCKPITVQHAYVDADLTDFPYIVFIDADTDIGVHALATGYDIRFTAADGVTLLSYERRSFSIAAGAATGRFVVKVPTIATAGGTIIGIHYGKAGASDGADAANAYDANFKGVWPCTDLTTSTIADSLGVSTGNKKAANEPIEEAGPIWKAQHFDGVDDDINCGSDASLVDIVDNLTIEAWVNPDIIPSASYRGIVGTDGTSWELMISGDSPSDFMFTGNSIGYQRYVQTLSAGVFQYLCATYRSSDGRMQTFFNGVQGTDYAFGARDLDTPVRIRIGKYLPWDGLIAEVRITHGIRSVSWIKFTYRNISEADHEQEWGAEVSASVTYTLAGSINAASAMSGDAKMTARLAGSIQAASAFTGETKAVMRLAGDITGASVIGGGMKMIMRLAGSISGISTLTADLINALFNIPKSIIFRVEPRKRIAIVPDRKRIRVVPDRGRIVTVDKRT